MEKAPPMGVRIYEILFGKDFPLTKKADKEGETRIVDDKKPAPDAVPPTGLKRVDQREDEAVNTDRKAYADGGPIVGPGTGTSDSVPIQASNGEYMIPAAVVDFIGIPTLDKMVQQTMMAIQQRGGPGQPGQQAPAMNPYDDLFAEEDAPSAETKGPLETSSKSKPEPRSEPKPSSEARSSSMSNIPRDPPKEPAKSVPTKSAPHPGPRPTSEGPPKSAKKGSIANAAPARVAY
jgi:hypothetical protein